MWRSVICAAALVLGGCSEIFPSDRLRQRITVEVETPLGLRSGSSVVETKVQEGKSWGDASGTSFTLEGEAVGVDLPEGRTLFALLRGDSDTQGDQAGYQTRLLYDALNAGAKVNVPVPVEGLDLIQARAAAKRADASLTLPEKLYPMLVTFGDITNPKSVERVNPADLAELFGPGVRLRRVSVEVTNDAVTTGIEKRFSWWSSFRDHHFDGTSTVSEDMISRDLAAHMSSGSFSTEFNKP